MACLVFLPTEEERRFQANFDRIQLGQTRGEVEAILGPPPSEEMVQDLGRFAHVYGYLTTLRLIEGNRRVIRRIIRRAGIKPWPRPFQNLRSSRETELAESFPLHVVCQWIGNTARVATAHYLQVTEEHFQRAAKSGAQALQNPVQQPAAPFGTDSQVWSETDDASDVMPCGATLGETLQFGGLAAAGFEPASPLRGEGF